MKKTAAAAFTALLGLMLCIPAYAKTEGAWTADGRRFVKADGNTAYNEWIEGENGSYFYVGADGSYVTGWQTIKEQNSDAEHMYYFNPADGAMFYDTYTPDGYWVNRDGVRTGERKDDAAAPETGSPAGTEKAETEQNESVSAEESKPAENESVEAGAAEETGASKQEETVSDGFLKERAEELIGIVNAKRAEIGKPALLVDPDLEAASEVRAREIANYTDDRNIYLRPEKHYMAEAKGTQNEYTTSSVTAVSEAARKRYTKGNVIMITESAAWGKESAQAAVEDWFSKNSDGKDKTNKLFLLDTGGNGFDTIGASCYRKDGKEYYSVFIGARQ